MKFFSNEVLLEVLPEKSLLGEVADKFVMGNANTAQIFRYYEMSRDGQIAGEPEIAFYVHDYEKTVSELLQKFITIHAAGGIVRKADKILFIKRLGVWDLPKGKIESRESEIFAAQREVEEECNVKVKVVKKIGQTLHTYRTKGHDVLKYTHWYEMECLDDTQMSPQKEEDIELVQWISLADIRNTVLQDTYGSIRQIYEEFERQVSK